MKRSLFTASMALALSTYGQQKPVEQAELSFARYAADSSTKKAFLKFLHPQSLVFNQGAVYNGLRVWKSLPETPNKLLWYPTFSAMAQSGDLGFTTGPYEFRPAAPGAPTGAGQYTSVWQKTEAGEWKVLTDLGIGYPVSEFEKQQSRALVTPLVGDTSQLKAQDIELGLLENYQQLGAQAFAPLLLTDSWFNLEGQPPLHSQEAIVKALDKLPQGLTFTPLGGTISKAKDLAYVYGTVTSAQGKENYLRIWVHTAEGWKLLVQVLKWV